MSRYDDDSYEPLPELHPHTQAANQVIDAINDLEALARDLDAVIAMVEACAEAARAMKRELAEDLVRSTLDARIGVDADAQRRIDATISAARRAASGAVEARRAREMIAAARVADDGEDVR